MPKYRCVTTAEAARSLADLLNGNTRTRPVVVVTTPHGQDTPWIDIDDLADQVGDLAEVYLMPTGKHSWELSRNLPEMTQVYGGAGRVYPLGHEWASDPRRPPLRFAYGKEEGARATGQLIDDALRMATAAGLFDSRSTARRTRRTGIVEAIVAERAWVRFDGSLGLVPDALAFPGVPLERCVTAGQRLTGLYDPTSRWFDVRESRLTPEQALAPYAIGDAVLAQVETVAADQATVFLHPLTTTTLDREQVTSNDLDDLRDLMTPGEVLVVRVTALAPHWRLSMLDIEDWEVPVAAAALFPGGPPWLVPAPESPEPAVDLLSDLVPPPFELPIEEPTEEAAQEAGPESALDEPPQPGPTLPPRPSPALLDRRRAGRPTPAPAEPALTAGSTPGSTAGATRSMSLTISALKAQVAQLQRQRDELQPKASGLSLEVTHLKSDLHRAQAQVQHLEKQLEHSRAKLRKTRTTPAETSRVRFADREQGFRFLVEQAWATRIPPSEQAQCPLPRVVFGDLFLDSVEQLTGISAEKIADVVMEVLTGKAQQSAGRALHRLRVDEGGGSPQVVRSDGARAWRANLQTNTPSARRLHYWELPDGTIELAKVGLHDDTTI